MIRTKICQRIFDSDADPYIEQKDVILCRSGIQLYHKSELSAFISEDNKPPVEKEWYKEYRPANVVVKAKKLCASLPVTKEHPSDWVTPDNWKELAGGTTDKEVEVVALEGEAEGEIGLKSSLTFYDRDLYQYYEENNKEVSLGYTCKKHWVDNPEEVGYDIILDEISEVNHLAITRAGRGGSSVAVIDSLLGGLRPMRTGIFAWLGKDKQKDSAVIPFGTLVFDSIKASKGETEEEIAKDMKRVIDSCAVLKDCEGKTTLINAVKDCFDNKEKAIANEEELTKAFDSMYVSVSGDSLEEIVKAFKCLGVKTDTVEAKTTDSEEKTEESEEKTEDSEEKTEDSEEKTEEKTEDSEEKTEEKDACKDKEDSEKQKDSVPSLDSATVALIDKLVTEKVKAILGVSKDTKPEVQGGVIDSVNNGSEEVFARDYSSFLDK